MNENIQSISVYEVKTWYDKEADLIRQIETDPAIDEGFRHGRLIKGNVVEIKYIGKDRPRAKHDSKK